MPREQHTALAPPACDQERRNGFRGFTLTKRLISAPDVSSAQLSLCAQLLGARFLYGSFGLTRGRSSHPEAVFTPGGGTWAEQAEQAEQI